MAKKALFLEGGGVRCVFTAGVLDAFLDREIFFDDVYGISAGAVVGLNYVSGQKGRTKTIFTQYLHDPRYSGKKFFLTKGEFFNKDFIFDEIPNKLVPLDYNALWSSKSQLYTVVTDCQTGVVEYLPLPDDKLGVQRVQEAASSLPLLSKPVHYNDKIYLDGGIAKPLLCHELLEQAYDEVLFVMTQKMGYQKQPEKALPLIKVLLHKYPSIAEHIARRHTVYNQTLAEINHLGETDQRVTVIRPVEPFNVKRVDSNMENANFAYEQGYEMGMAYQE